MADLVASPDTTVTNPTESHDVADSVGHPCSSSGGLVAESSITGRLWTDISFCSHASGRLGVLASDSYSAVSLESTGHIITCAHAARSASFADPVAIQLPRRKPTQSAVTVKMGCAPYVPPNEAYPVGTNIPLELAGHTQTPTVAQVPMDQALPCLYTSFDSTHGVRVLQGEVEWTEQQFIAHALSTATYGPFASARILQEEAIGFPSPQVAISQQPNTRAIVINAATVYGQVEVLDVHQGVSAQRVIVGLVTPARVSAIVEAIVHGSLLCVCNREAVRLEAAIPAATDVIQFVQVRNVAGGEARDETPIPERREAVEVIRVYGPRPRTPAIPFRPPVPPIPKKTVPSRDVVRRYRPDKLQGQPFTVFDAHYGHRTFQSPAFSSHALKLQLAVQASPALGLSPRYAWLDREIEGLPVPQLVLQQAHVPAGHWTFPLDLRPCSGHVCVLIADRQCSAAEFFARASDVCRLSKRLASLIDEGLMVLEVDGHTVNSADAAVLKFASVTRLRRTGLWGRHLPRHPWPL